MGFELLALGSHFSPFHPNFFAEKLCQQFKSESLFRPNADNSDASSSTKRESGTRRHLSIANKKTNSGQLWSEDDIHPDKVVLE